MARGAGRIRCEMSGSKLRLALLAGAVAVLGAVALSLFTTRDQGPTLTEPEEAPPAPPPVTEVVAPDPAPEVTEAPVVAAPRTSRPMGYEHYPFLEGEKLHGVVTDATSGQPMDFLTVHLAKVDDGDIHFLARERNHAKIFRDTKGNFLIRALDPGQYNLLIRCAGYSDVVVEDFAVPCESLELTMSRGSFIEVTTADSWGDGIGGVEVRLVPVRLDEVTTEGKPKTPSVRLRRTDDYGKALFSDLPTGVYRVELLNKALAADPSPEFYLGPGKSFPVKFQIKELNVLTVEVSDSAGHALGNTQIRLWSKGPDQSNFRLQTDRDGKAETQFVPQGTYRMKLWKPGFLRLARTISVPYVNGGHVEKVVMTVDPTDGEAERNPTLEQLQRLRAGEDPVSVFGIDEDK